MRKILLSLLALLVTVTLFAAPRTVEEAAAIAARFTNSQPQLSRMHKAPRKAADMKLAHKANMPNSTQPALYIFNQNGDEGFVIISADDNAVEILGYSDEGAFDATNIPSNVQFWLDFVSERVAAIAAQPTPNKMKQVRKAKQVTAIAPLLGNIKWNQGEPYNNLCPMDKQTRAYTGCVATAAAQIMKMYNWPETGQGSHTDNWRSDAGKTGTSSANFGATTYDWANMLDSYKGSYTDAQATAVATLMFHVGVSCDMQYGGDESNGSGAFTNDMGTALVSYFRYKNTATYKSNQSNSQLTSLFNTELEAGRPILMGGSNSEGGHEFVCDGRDESGLFHINWGWGGTSNGHFALNGLDPDQQGAGGSSSGYNQQIDCVIGIEPDRDPVSVTGISVAPTSITIDIKGHEQLTATVTPEDASNKSFSWTSSNPSIATVSSMGVVVGVSTGDAIITATTNDGGKTASCTVHVTEDIAAATVLNVNAGDAEYDESYVDIDMPWAYYVWDDNDANGTPTVCFWPTYTGTNAIAGSYTLSGQCGYVYLPGASESINITSGQLVITCVGKNNGANGCNTYRVLSYFTCEDGIEYKVDVTTEICAHTYAEQESDQEAIALSGDKVGDGQAYELTWMAQDQVFETGIAVNNKITLPTAKPGNCESGKVFVGWSKTEIEETDTKPTFAKNGDAVTANTTFYAVYATLEGGGSSTVTFTPGTDKGETSVTKDNITCTMTTMNNDSYYQIYADQSGTFSCSTGNITKIEFECTVSGTDKYGPGNASADGGNYSYSGNTGTWTGEAASVTISTTKQIRMTTLSITAGSGTYSAYATSCGAPAEKYAITINPSTNGSLATSPSTEAAAGRKVTVTATPATHYQLATLTVKDADDATVAVSGEGNVRTFTMPAKAVTISGTFEEQAKVTVRFFDKGEQISSAQYFIGETAQKPANPIPSCDAYTFVGWWTAELPANNKEAKAWITNFTVTEAKDYYAIYSLTEDGQGAATFDGTTGGNFKIYAEVSNDKYYATNEVNDANKVESTTNAAEAGTFTFEKVSGGFTIKTGTQYLAYSGSSTNVELSNSAYTWDIQSNSGAWRVMASDTRALALRVTNYYQSFGAYATSNASTSGYYFNLEIEGVISSSTFYSSILNCGGTDIENTAEELKAIKIIRNGQLYILVGDQMYTVTGARVQ